MTKFNHNYFSFFKIRIIIPVVLTIILFLIAFFVIFIPSLEDNLLNKKREMIKELVNSVWSVLDLYNSQYTEGSIGLDEAKELVIGKVKNLRYGPESKDYFWISDLTPNMIVHPYRPELNGQSLLDYSDPNGKKMFVEFARIVREAGEGYSEYIWQWKDDPDRLVPKLSYVKGYVPWGWIIGTGVYIEDVESEIRSIINKLLFTLLWILGMVSTLLIYLTNEGFRIENERQKSLKKLAESESRYRTIFEKTGTAFMISEADTTISMVNSEFEKITGYTKEEIEGKRKWTELIHKDELDRMTQFHFKRRTDQKKIPSKYESRALDRHGEIKNIYISVEMIPGTNKSIISFVDITKQKRIEAELLKEKNLSLNLVQSSPAYYVATDRDHNILMANDPLLDTTGFSLDDLVGKNVVDILIPEKNREMVTRILNILTTAKISNTNEGAIQTSGGRTIPVEWHRKVVLRDDGEIDYFINLGIDISGRQKAEDELKKSEIRYRTLFETANDAIFVFKDDKTILCNKKAQELFRCREDMIIGKTPIDLSPEFQPDGSRSDIEAIEKIRKAYAGSLRHFEWMHKRFDDTVFDAEISLSIIDWSGEKCLQAIIKDISERKKMETALIESEKKYRVLAETSFAGIVLLDDKERITYANPAFIDMAGSSLNRIINKDLLEVITIEEYKNSVAFNLDQDTRKHKYFESTVFKNDGSIMNVLISATPLLSAENSFQGTLCVIVDITQMKNMETELAFSKNMSAIGELSRKIAHEIGNPLTSIMNCASLLKRKIELDSDNEKLMTIIIDETKRLDGIIIDFLKFSSTKEPIFRKHNILNCINEQILLLKNNDQYLAKKINIEVINGDILPEIYIDMDLIKNVLWNLLINSIQAIEFEGTIRIEIFEDEKSVEHISITISDNGKGIGKKDLQKIFEPYFTTKSRGSGIGLSVVKKIISDHNGLIQVSSTAGEGTSFKIKLPIRHKEKDV